MLLFHFLFRLDPLDTTMHYYDHDRHCVRRKYNSNIIAWIRTEWVFSLRSLTVAFLELCDFEVHCKMLLIWWFNMMVYLLTRRFVKSKACLTKPGFDLSCTECRSRLDGFLRIRIYSVYSKIPILRPPLGLSKSGLKDHFWTVPRVVCNQMYTGCRKWRKE